MYTDRKALVISNGVKKNGSDVFAILDPDTGGAATFAVPLIGVADPDTTEATHWGASTVLLQTAFDALTTMTTQEFKTYVDAEAARLNRTPAGNITAFKNDIQISPDGVGFWDFLASLGLRRKPAA